MKKTKKAVKGKVKKQAKKVLSRSVKNEITIRVQPVPAVVSQTDLAPEIDGGKYMIPKTWMSERQVLRMVQQTPQQHIYSRKGKGGGSFSYVTQSYVVKVLNFVFGWNWDFEVVEQGREQDQVWVKGKLTVKSPKGEQIIKTQYGRADIKFFKGTKNMVDYGNDLKAAASDCLKKCASLLGVASDIYGKSEMKDEAGKDFMEMPALPAPAPAPQDPKQPQALKPGQVMGPDGKPVYLCNVGQEIISEAEYNYSMKLYKKPLCREHQKNHGK